MAGSLRDQLLKAGLVSKQQVRDSKRKSHNKRKQVSNKGENAVEGISLAQAYGQRSQQEKRERDQELNRKREEAKRRKEIKAQLRQVIVSNSLNDKKAEIARHFEHNGKIRKLYINKDQQTGLNSGRFGIAYLAGRYYLLDGERIAKVAAIEGSAVALHISGDQTAAESDDQEYTQFKVPDDLMW